VRGREIAGAGSGPDAVRIPMKKGRCGTITHDYKRNGTTCLFAALNVLEGKVIGSCYPRHRNIEFRQFLRQTDRETPKDLAIHMFLDNYGSHNHAQSQGVVSQWRSSRSLIRSSNAVRSPMLGRPTCSASEKAAAPPKIAKSSMPIFGSGLFSVVMLCLLQTRIV